MYGASPNSKKPVRESAAPKSEAVSKTGFPGFLKRLAG
jgi:hypothetical protein